MPTARPAPPAASPSAGSGSVLLLVVTALIVLTQLYAAIPLLGPVSASLGGDATFALSTVFSLCYAAGFLFWGPVCDHVGRRRVLLIGLALLAATTFACGLASSAAALMPLRGAQGFAAASFAPTALAYLSEALPPKRRPGAIGAMSTAFLVAGILGQLLASAIALRPGWPWLFYGSGVALAVAAVLATRLAAEPAREEGSNPSTRIGDRFLATAKVAAKPAVLLLCAAHLTLLLSFVGMYTALGPHLEALGLDTLQVIWIRAVGLPGMFVSLAVGPLSQRLGMAGVARAGYLLAAAGIAAEALLARSLIGLGAASLLFVAGVALAIPAMITLFGETAAPNRAGGIALNGFVLFLGASIGPLAARGPIAYAPLLLAFAASLLTAALCLTAFARLRTPEAADRAEPAIPAGARGR